jgi:FkbM family methyltransferase
MELAFVKTIYFSQFGEDAFVDLHFSGKKSGFYVDVGAFHPFNISNTYVFYKRGWRGINIEPNPASFRAFPKYRSRDINVNVAVGLENAEVLFNCLEELSGIDSERHLFRKRRRSNNQCMVKSIPLSSILHEHLPKGEVIDFMSIDCEGFDEEVLRSNDWDRFRPEIILIEDRDREKSIINNFLYSVGYHFERKLGLTKVFIEDENQ